MVMPSSSALLERNNLKAVTCSRVQLSPLFPLDIWTAQHNTYFLITWAKTIVLHWHARNGLNLLTDYLSTEQNPASLKNKIQFSNIRCLIKMLLLLLLLLLITIIIIRRSIRRRRKRRRRTRNNSQMPIHVSSTKLYMNTNSMLYTVHVSEQYANKYKYQ